MGNLRRFRLSDMMPNAWFYKLRDGAAAAGKPTTLKKPAKKPTKLLHLQPNSSPKPDQTHHHFSSYSRKSYHFTRDLKTSPDDLLPRKSTGRQRPKRSTTTTNTAAAARSSPKLVSSSSVAVGCSCRDPNYSASMSDSDSFSPEFRSDCSLTTESCDKMVSWSSNSCGCPLELVDSSPGDIVIDVVKQYSAVNNSSEKNALQVFDDFPRRNLPPILTKAIKRKDTKDQPATKQRWKHCTAGNSPGIKLRLNSPRIGYRRRNQAAARKSASSPVSGCLAVVKSSFDPQRDFKESMVEMIVENNISSSKDLEDLLACYLSLNSDEYHDVIIRVFKQIWFDHLTNSCSSK
ncbi:Transcription repressor OFP1 [Linum perenne]